MQDTDNHIPSTTARCGHVATAHDVSADRSRQHRPTVLSVAGSDSIGGAGIQADIKACMALGVFAMTAITAVTAQNTVGVRSYVNVGAESVRAQLEAVFDDVCPGAVKIGMVPDGATAVAIAEVLARRYAGSVVLDPVAVATSGDRLSDDSAAAEMVRRLFPMATVVTPNIPEARMLSGMDIATQSDMRLPHVPLSVATDVVPYSLKADIWWTHRYIRQTKNNPMCRSLRQTPKQRVR